MTTQPEYLKTNYIPLIKDYLDSKIDLDTFATHYFSSFRQDPSLYGDGRRYPENISEIIHQLFTDIDVADNDFEETDPLFLSENSLKKLCQQYLEKLIQLTQ